MRAGSPVNRLDTTQAMQLVEKYWPPHEVRMHHETQLTRTTTPSWQTEVLSYPDLGPSDSLFARNNRNRPKNAMSWNPEAELLDCNEVLSAIPLQDGYPGGEGKEWSDPSSDAVPQSVSTLYKRSEMRTPLLVPWTAPGLGSPGIASQAIGSLAEDRGTSLDTVHLKEWEDIDVDEVLAKVDECLNKGLWLALHEADAGRLNHDLYRKLALRLMTVAPDPLNFPRREFFRLWIVTRDTVDLDDTGPLPAVLARQVLQLCKGEACEHKVVRALPTDPILREKEVKRREQQQEQGIDADAEPIPGDPASAQEIHITGSWFTRSGE
eukprot:Sspe_Gene.46282::Locus_23086_Transcript_2_2_Confidence_0.667_Length_1047::g.46282::m.46282